MIWKFDALAKTVLYKSQTFRNITHGINQSSLSLLRTSNSWLTTVRNGNSIPSAFSNDMSELPFAHHRVSACSLRAQRDLLTRVPRGLMLGRLAPFPPGSSC